MKLTRTKWFLPLFAVGLGLAMLAAQWIGGHPGSGLGSLALMCGFGALVLFGGRSETIKGLRGDGSDERFRELDVRATAFAGGVVICAVIVAFLVEMARGHTGSPYSWLGAIGGVAYVASVVVLRLRG
jgi:hypothetical protein